MDISYLSYMKHACCGGDLKELENSITHSRVTEAWKQSRWPGVRQLSRLVGGTINLVTPPVYLIRALRAGFGGIASQRPCVSERATPIPLPEPVSHDVATRGQTFITVNMASILYILHLCQQESPSDLWESLCPSTWVIKCSLYLDGERQLEE